MLYKIAILLFGLTCVLGAAIPDTDVETTALAEERIIGGYNVTIEKFPWQVSINFTLGGFVCGGTIYSSKIVITSASCVDATLPFKVFVHAGSNYTYGGFVFPVFAIIVHPSFDPATYQADLALVKLLLPITFSTTMRAVPLARSLPAHGDPARVSGWGTTVVGGTGPSRRLHAANVNIISWAQCRSSDYGYGTAILPGMICAAAAGRDACAGDTGGPLMSGGVLVGIVSWGRSCARPFYPGVYTSVAPYSDWLINTANQWT